jgi:hypothetical protein
LFKNSKCLNIAEFFVQFLIGRSSGHQRMPQEHCGETQFTIKEFLIVDHQRILYHRNTVETRDLTHATGALTCGET